MTDRKAAKPKVEKLELNKETVHELTESEAEGAQGGKRRAPHKGRAPGRAQTGHTCTCQTCPYQATCVTSQEYCPGPVEA